MILSHFRSRRPGGRGRPWRRRAAAAVEFALFAPLLGILVVGMLELGRGIIVKEILTDAVRKAGRTAILPNQDNAAIIAEANNIFSDNQINAPGATVTILVNGQAVDAKTAVRGDQISVKVSVPAAQVLWLAPFFLQNGSIESETIIMMRQA
jgi:Flp pilus assembly protein TadG